MNTANILEIIEQNTGEIHQYTNGNFITIYGDVIEIEIESKGSIHYSYLDIDDIDLVQEAKFYLNNGYVTGKTIAIHRLLCPSNNQVDHIDRNPLNNCKNNLRPVTESQNQQNQGIRTDNNSGVKGVYFDLKNKRWIAKLTINGIVYTSSHLFKHQAVAKRKLLETQHHTHRIEPNTDAQDIIEAFKIEDIAINKYLKENCK